MSPGNPYQSPTASSDVATAGAGRRLRPPYLWTAILLLMGGCFLLLLNGQYFSNAIVFLGFMVTSTLLWTRFVVRSKQGEHRRFALYVLLMHLVAIVGFASNLPEKFRRQQDFNNLVNESREGVGKSGRK